MWLNSSLASLPSEQLIDSHFSQINKLSIIISSLAGLAGLALCTRPKVVRLWFVRGIDPGAEISYPHVCGVPHLTLKMGSKGRKMFRRSTHMTFGDRKAFERCTNTLTSIFSIAATVVFGQLASPVGNGVPIAPLSPTSFIPGHAFDRFVIITLENTVVYSCAKLILI